MAAKLLRWMLILLPTTLPLYVVRFNIGPLPTTLLEFYIALLGIIWLIDLGISSQWSVKTIQSSLRDIRHSIGIWFWPIVTWLAVTLITVFISPDSWGAFGHWRAFVLEPVMIFIVLMDYLAERSPGIARTGIFYSMAAVTIALGIYSIIQYLTGWGIPAPWETWPGRRTTGTFGFPNGLSLFIVPFGIVCFITWIQSIQQSTNKQFPLTRGRRGLILGASLLALTGAVLAKSMGGILTFGIGMILTLLVYKKTRLIGTILGVIGIIGAGIVAWQIMGTELHPQTIEDTLAASKKWSGSVRIIIWKESFEIIKHHPLLGTGLRSYQTAIAPYHEATWMEIYPHPHNIFLMLWIETGLAGLLAFLWIITTWIRVVPRASYIVQNDKNKDPSTTRCEVRGTRYENLIWLIPLIVILIHGLVDMPYFKNDLAIQFWLLAAIASTHLNCHPGSDPGPNK